MVSLSDLTKNNNRDPLWLKLKRRLQRIIAAYRSITFGQWSICHFYPLLRFIYRKSAIETQNNKMIEKHSMILSKCDRKLLTCIKVEFQNGVMWKNVNSAHDYPMSISRNAKVLTSIMLSDYAYLCYWTDLEFGWRFQDFFCFSNRVDSVRVWQCRARMTFVSRL